MFAIFVAMIAGILTSPLPSGALLFLSLALALFTNTITIKAALVGFSSGTVWLIFCAYILSLGFISSGLGRRVAFTLLSRFGDSSLGVAYALGTADLLMASAMPSVTARGGGIIMPVVKSINLVMDSGPGEKGRRIGDFLMMTCIQFTILRARKPLTFSHGEESRSCVSTTIRWIFGHNDDRKSPKTNKPDETYRDRELLCDV